MNPELVTVHSDEARVTVSGGSGRFVRIDGFRCPDTNVRLLMKISGWYGFICLPKINKKFRVTEHYFHTVKLHIIIIIIK